MIATSIKNKVCMKKFVSMTTNHLNVEVEPNAEIFYVLNLTSILVNVQHNNGVILETVGIRVSQFPEIGTVWHICDETWF